MASEDGAPCPAVPNPFELRRRAIEDTSSFNVVMVVPTGIGAWIGGHAGDATPAAQLLAAACDTLITHPNVINASDIAELPENGLYVEGSVLSRFMLGAIGLQPVRSNRVLVVIEKHRDRTFIHDTINAVNGARATYGLDCPEIIVLDPPYSMRARFTSQGCAAGRVENLRPLIEVLEDRAGSYDAVALASLVDLPDHLQAEYFTAKDECVNPWGGVEAMLTHTVSGLFDVPSAHAPMMESIEVANMDFGVVDPRKAAEMISMTFFNSVLKGLKRSPRIIVGEPMARASVLTAENISVLVQPDGCLGLPTLAALEQGIPANARIAGSFRSRTTQIGSSDRHTRGAAGSRATSWTPPPSSNTSTTISRRDGRCFICIHPCGSGIEAASLYMPAQDPANPRNSCGIPWSVVFAHGSTACPVRCRARPADPAVPARCRSSLRNLAQVSAILTESH